MSYLGEQNNLIKQKNKQEKIHLVFWFFIKCNQCTHFPLTESQYTVTSHSSCRSYYNTDKDGPKCRHRPVTVEEMVMIQTSQSVRLADTSCSTGTKTGNRMAGMLEHAKHRHEWFHMFSGCKLPLWKAVLYENNKIIWK